MLFPNIWAFYFEIIFCFVATKKVIVTLNSWFLQIDSITDVFYSQKHFL